MINVVSKSANLSPYLKVSSQAVASSAKPLVKPTKLSSAKPVYPTHPVALTNYALTKLLPSNDIRVKNGPTVTTQVRFAHTDIQVPDFTFYRRSATKDPKSKRLENDDSRKAFTYLIVGGGAVTTAYAAKSVVRQLVSTMSASADVLALAKIEVKLGSIPEGKSVTFKWRGKPLFIRHRTPQEISVERGVPMNELRDPQHDNERVQKPEWLVLIGVCTHLGCVPIANAGDFGGYYCPCHGSHYDASGRIRKGPAPLNLEIPPYEFQTEELLVVG
ncbi:cytochrome b-c1 complex subunit Rieske, mitochondrial [Macrosteles quadrilineatus]|uniref:cytochrome b-c1 complex subunit Rieske, mitochondrial n=1 Tax=Macrosteles quadrilineatus TaxID=74068 RepID=UPI0023E1939C|nr:cytochrome b-c1 complex subunit Rieske, mitochondrial [Macrosteles quadrilineatus]